MKENIILSKSKKFALDSMILYKDLIDKREFILSKQFFRSATSIGLMLMKQQLVIQKKTLL